MMDNKKTGGDTNKGPGIGPRSSFSSGSVAKVKVGVKPVPSDKRGKDSKSH